MSLQESREIIASLEQQLEETRTEFKRTKGKLRGMLENERALGEKKAEGQSWHEKEIKELRRKIKKYENHYGSRKGKISVVCYSSTHFIVNRKIIPKSSIRIGVVFFLPLTLEYLLFNLKI